MKKRLIVLITSLCVLCSTAPVMAATSIGSAADDISNTVKIGKDVTQGQESEYYPSITADAENVECSVYLTRSSAFNVTIPKKFVLDGTKTSDTIQYSVKVSGDWCGDEVVSVVPDTTFNLKQAGAPDVVCTVAQAKTTFKIGDGLVTESNLASGVTTTGTISYSGLKAGNWNGSFKFKISITED